jgi:hypothetical protein
VPSTNGASALESSCVPLIKKNVSTGNLCLAQAQI